MLERAATSSSRSVPFIAIGKKTWPSASCLGSAQAWPMAILPCRKECALAIVGKKMASRKVLLNI
jgi:hypothetical protein